MMKEFESYEEAQTQTEKQSVQDLIELLGETGYSEIRINQVTLIPNSLGHENKPFATDRTRMQIQRAQQEGISSEIIKLFVDLGLTQRNLLHQFGGIDSDALITLEELGYDENQGFFTESP